MTPTHSRRARATRPSRPSLYYHTLLYSSTNSTRSTTTVVVTLTLTLTLTLTMTITLAPYGPKPDVEFAVKDGEVQVRSSSRLGFLDLDVNAKRLNWISADLRAKGWTAPAITYGFTCRRL